MSTETINEQTNSNAQTGTNVFGHPCRKGSAADVSSNSNAQLLRNFIASQKNPAGLDVWIRDVLCGTPNMANRLKYARDDANELRRRADQIEGRAVDSLAEDIEAEWTPQAIRAAVAKPPADRQPQPRATGLH